MEQELRLNEFKTLYKTWKTGVPPLDYLLLGLLSWFEQKLLDNRIKTDLDAAIEQYDTLLPPSPTPVYTETPSASANSHSKTSTSLPEMRLTAPWYDPVDNGAEGG